MYSVQEIAKLWNLSDRRVREMCNKGLIPNVQKIGKSYLIPKNSIRPAAKKKEICIPKNNICFVCKDDNNILCSSLAYNFFRSDQNVDCNAKILKIDKSLKTNKVDTKSIIKSLNNDDYKCIVFINHIDKSIVENSGNTKKIYIGKSPVKTPSIFQIVGLALPEATAFTSLGLSFFCIEGILKQVYDIVCDIVNNKYSIPMIFNFNNKEHSPSLIYKLPTIQKSYEFLAKQYDSFDDRDVFYPVNIGNQVEFSDSNQELDYAVKIINALKRNVSANFVYIYDKHNLKKFYLHFTTKAYLQNLNNKSSLYLIERSKLNKYSLQLVGQGVILYKDKGVYHDDITEYSLGYVNANKDHIEKYQKLIDEIIEKSTKISNTQEMEAFYELQK